MPIQHAIIGTCTNGRLEDLEIAAKILDGKKVKEGVTLIITPASRTVYLEAIKYGYIEIFLKAGASIAIPGCSACSGGSYVGIPADCESVITTANRNFKGRLGNPNSFLYLASPATVAASALTGKIEDSRKYVR
jgi:3-isopropylmalate/(R)-2-methylmalate dehydratase large subunit